MPAVRSEGRMAACLLASWLVAACSPEQVSGRTTLVFPGSAVGDEAEVLHRQIGRFMALHPEVDVVVRPTPDAADERHQLYVQWLAAGLGEPDVLQLDVIWTPEFAAAGWVMPLDRFAPDTGDVFEGVRAADEWQGRLYAMPWFVDVGMLYWRTDLLEAPPETFEALERDVRAGLRAPGVDDGLVLEAARYEGLVTTFQEVLGGFGGRLVDAQGRVAVDSPEGVRALGWLKGALASGIVPEEALTWREEPARFAFQNGRAVFMRNWPYAYAPMNDPARSAVAGRFAVAPMPAAPGGRHTAALGGSQLAINAHTRHPEAAFALVDYLTRPEQMIERARITGQLPPREGLYDDPRLAEALAIPVDQAREILRAARPRPTTPVYTALSEALQVHLHRALTGQEPPRTALARAATGMRAALARLERPPPKAGFGAWLVLGGLALAAALGVALGVRRVLRAPASAYPERGVGWAFVAPAVGLIVLVAVFPLGWTLVESFFHHDLRMPWLGRSFVGLANYLEAVRSPRLLAALAHTAVFATISVSLELVLGLAFALLLDRTFRGRGVARVTVLVPWALPTVVAALLWRFIFEGDAGVANAVLERTGLASHPVVWFGHAVTAWVPVILADVWKSTPFVALLLLAGLQGIDETLYESARVDGAGAWARLRHVTLPLLLPAIGVALLFRSLDALRVFGLVYVLTGGGPGTATEPIALYTWSALLQDLRFGYGSALSTLVFVLSFALALVYVRLLSPGRET